MNSLKEQEYLSLREEIQTNLKTQQSWSTFSIGAVLTLVGVALKWETPEIYLLPIVLLLLVSLKMRNYRQSIMNISAYMIARDEDHDGFYWETCLNRQRKDRQNEYKSFMMKITDILETQELTLMGSMCAVLYVAELYFSNRPIDAEIIILVHLSLTGIILTALFSKDYWDMDPAIVDKKIEEWREIIKTLDDCRSGHESPHAEAQEQVHSEEVDVHS